jgi:hypothetical protein
MDIEKQCSCRWVYVNMTELVAGDDGAEGVGAGLDVQGVQLRVVMHQKVEGCIGLLGGRK